MTDTMRLYRYIMSALCIASLAACSDDDNNFAQPEYPEAPAVTAVSVENGARVNPAEVTEITVTYSAPVTVNPAERITLNERGIIPTVTDGNVLHLAVSLTHSTEYELNIPAKAVIANRGLHYAPAVNVKFSTIDKAEEVFDNPFDALTNPNATAQAQNVYEFLCRINGEKILSGAMANVNNNNDFALWINRFTGKMPALTGYDFIHVAQSAPGAWIDYSDISPATEQWENNGLVSYMWHWSVPSTEEDYRAGNANKYGFYVPGAGSSDTEFDIREALKEGTWQHECIMADIDKVAAHLRQLQDAGIPVIWRPLHEAAGDYRYNNPWFWWGRYGTEYTRQLWVLMHDRLVNHHGLNNLIWVWTAQCSEGHDAEMKESYPGNEYVDIVGVDLYPDNNNSQKSAYDMALNMTEGHKLVTLSECGRIPDPRKCITEKAAWSWFMVWYSYNIADNAAQDNFGNTRDYFNSVMSSPFVIDRAQMPSLK